jgi:hypothetical protein
MCLQLMPILDHQAAQTRVQFLQPFPRLQFLPSQIELLDRGALLSDCIRCIHWWSRGRLDKLPIEAGARAGVLAKSKAL